MQNNYVKQERSGWRDLGLNERHRAWGFNCPATDVDQLFIEYNRGKAVAIVEYKNEHAQPQQMEHPSYQAMIDLANRAQLPAFFVRYATDFRWFRAYPMNERATEWVGVNYLDLSERGYVELMYRVRGMTCPADVLAPLRDETETPSTVLDDVDWRIRKLRAKTYPRNAPYPYK